VTTESLIPRPPEGVNVQVNEVLTQALTAVVQAVDAGATPRQLEREVWNHVLRIGRLLLSYALSQAARRATLEDLAQRGLQPHEFRIRADRGYWQTIKTTLGVVTFLVYAYRDRSSRVAAVTHTPAMRGPFALQQRCKSSELLVEWETRLGAELPFRRADEALTFFSHGATKVEDTTIARHMVRVGSLVGREWLYRPVAELRTVLTDRATRDRDTDKPILYASCDAHALRRFVDETWDAQWKMANGVRLWCIDKKSGATIHIGGEYTWGDCHEVEAIFAALIASGHLPKNGDYGDGLAAQLVFVTDAMPWFEDYVFRQFPHAVRIVDAYHVIERIAAYANDRYGRGSKAAQEWTEAASTALFGARPAERKGRRKRKGPRERNTRRPGRPPHRPAPGLAGGTALEAFLENDRLDGEDTEPHRLLRRFVSRHKAHLDYPDFHWRGFQIGSGAMESLHRTASQSRLKIPGGRWLAETSQAIFNLRMMILAGRWDTFWSQADLTSRLAGAFSPHVTPRRLVAD
jgi:hypothetical protein